MTVLAMAGDGGTGDIGIQALSGAAERNDDFIYLCYDNEAYMNTGTQRCGLTPAGARTTTTWAGKRENPKDLPRIMEAHGIPYVASTSAAFPDDVYDKVAQGARHPRPALHPHEHPVPQRLDASTPRTRVELGKLAVDTGLVVLYEIEDGVFRLTGRSASLAKSGARKPVADYVATQGRFRGMTAETIADVQAWVDKRWARLRRTQRDPGVAPGSRRSCVSYRGEAASLLRLDLDLERLGGRRYRSPTAAGRSG